MIPYVTDTNPPPPYLPSSPRSVLGAGGRGGSRLVPGARDLGSIVTSPEGFGFPATGGSNICLGLR